MTPSMSLGLGVTGNKKRKRSKKKKKELRVTQKGTGSDEPQLVSCSGSSGSEASDTTAADSGVNLASPVPGRTGHKKARLSNPTAGSHTSRTPPLSPDTRRELDAEVPGGNNSQMDDDNPLSGASDHPLSNADVEIEHEFSIIEFSDENDGGDGSGKDVSMDAETDISAGSAGCPRDGNAIHLLQPCYGDNTGAESHHKYCSGCSLW